MDKDPKNGGIKIIIRLQEHFEIAVPEIQQNFSKQPGQKSEKGSGKQSVIPFFTDIGGTLTVLPSLTESGRYRAEGDLRAKYEFVDDLYFEFKVYGSYDSKPPLSDSEQSDYGITTSLGYSF